MQTGGTGWNPNVTRNGEKVYQNLSQGNNTYMQMHTGLSEQMLEAYLRSEVKPNIVPPEFGIIELFKRGTSPEGIGELYSKGMDSKNKKMLPGLLGGDPEIAANLAGYTYFSPNKVQEIVDSFTPNGKAAYLLHTGKNMALDKVKTGIEVGGLIFAVVKSLEGGKVKTGTSQKDILKDELEELVEITDEVRKPATVEELVEMANKREGVEAVFADENGVEYLEKLLGGAEGSHMGFEDGTSSILFNKEKSTRKTVFHEWGHRYFWEKFGNEKPEWIDTPMKEEAYIEAILKKYERFLEIEGIK